MKKWLILLMSAVILVSCTKSVLIEPEKATVQTESEDDQDQAWPLPGIPYWNYIDACNAGLPGMPDAACGRIPTIMFSRKCGSHYGQ